MNFNSQRTIGVLAILSAICSNSVGKEIGFIEDFSLASDRSVPLSQLIPGTDDYYYFHCLDAQNNEKFDEVSTLLKAWEKTRGSSQFSRMPQVREIRHRQALLTYSRNAKQTLEYLKRELGLRFGHQRERLNGDSKLPSQISDEDVRREPFRREALRRHSNLDGFTEHAYHWLAKEKLSADQRRDLLGRLSTPDYDSLVEMVDMDLRHKGSRGFGSLKIHSRLTLRQLDRLLDRQTVLRNDTNFINTYLIRLRPDADSVVANDLVENREYLERVWKFVKTLPAARNSLKANILYQILKSDIREQSHSKKRLLEYLALPRSVPYVNTELLRDRENRKHPVDLGADFSKLTRTSPIGSDEQLVRDYLEHFFVTASNPKDFEPFIRSEYLKQLFAEVKLLHGLGDAERWYAMLSPENVQALKDRVEIEFDPANRTRFDIADPVHLSVHTKNVPKMLVKVYRINAVNYYQQTKREINTDINLDGLVAKDEQTYAYEDAPVRRVKRHFQLPQLDRAGVYVVDFIGNGISSRALIRKGNLRYFTRMTNAGQLVTVLDDSNQMVQDARLWMAGREYAPDSEGRILVPYATQARTEMIVLKHGDIASLKTFLHHGEEYSLNVGFYVDREALLAGNRASILVRPGLYLNGIPVSRMLLKDVRLTISSTDDEGIMSNETVTDLKVSDAVDLVHEVRVPDRTRTLSVRLDARVKQQTTGKDAVLSSNDSYTINEIDKSSNIEMANLVRSKAGHTVELVGKSGEPIAGRPVVFRLKHREFTDPLSITLQSGSTGIVTLGSLPEIESISAKTSTGTQFAWDLRRNSHSYPRSIHSQRGESIEVPLPNLADTVTPEKFALFELRGNVLTVNRFAAIVC